jgi:hypothetical protein
MLFERIKEEELIQMKNYISAYTESTEVEMAPMSHILRIWDEAKSEYLANLFKDELIISKEVSFEEGIDDIAKKVEALFNDDRIAKFQNAILNLYEDTKNLYYMDEDYDMWYTVKYLFNPYTLAANKIETNSYGKNSIRIGDKRMRLQDGAKPLRVIHKIAKVYNIGIEPEEDGISDFEYFCRKHSLCLNNKKLTGNLCFSIHPFDYMTMSDNDCDWSSCMSWEGNGEYRQGTVEMMNSPSVVVAYLTSSEPMHLWGGGTWNNKKWRCLFIVDRNFIVSIKSYPYTNDNLTKLAATELAALAGWSDPTIDNLGRNRDAYEDKNGRVIAIDFHTHTMYNDFGATENHYIIVNPEYTNDLLANYVYSGASECMICGTVDICKIGCDVDTERLACTDCHPAYWCENCDCDMPSSRNIYTTADGRRVCEYCWENDTVQDFLNEGDWYLEDNMTTIYLSTSNEGFSKFNWVPRIYVNNNFKGWSNCFNTEKPRWDDEEGRFYICPKDCKEGILKDILWEDGTDYEEFLKLVNDN